MMQPLMWSAKQRQLNSMLQHYCCRWDRSTPLIPALVIILWVPSDIQALLQPQFNDDIWSQSKWIHKEKVMLQYNSNLELYVLNLYTSLEQTITHYLPKSGFSGCSPSRPYNTSMSLWHAIECNTANKSKKGHIFSIILHPQGCSQCAASCWVFHFKFTFSLGRIRSLQHTMESGEDITKLRSYLENMILLIIGPSMDSEILLSNQRSPSFIEVETWSPQQPFSSWRKERELKYSLHP